MSQAISPARGEEKLSDGSGDISLRPHLTDDVGGCQNHHDADWSGIFSGV